MKHFSYRDCEGMETNVLHQTLKLGEVILIPSKFPILYFTPGLADEAILKHCTLLTLRDIALICRLFIYILCQNIFNTKLGVTPLKDDQPWSIERSMGLFDKCDYQFVKRLLIKNQISTLLRGEETYGIKLFCIAN